VSRVFPLSCLWEGRRVLYIFLRLYCWREGRERIWWSVVTYFSTRYQHALPRRCCGIGSASTLRQSGRSPAKPNCPTRQASLPFADQEMWYEISSGRFTFIGGKQSIIVKILWVMRQEENNIRWWSYGRTSCAPPSRRCITPPSRPPARAPSRLRLRPWPSGCAWPRAVLKYTRECSDACKPTWYASILDCRVKKNSPISLTACSVPDCQLKKNRLAWFLGGWRFLAWRLETCLA
jgi:hypothetical protein